MRLEHHLVGGYVRYISPYIIIIIIKDQGQRRQLPLLSIRPAFYKFLLNSTMEFNFALNNIQRVDKCTLLPFLIREFRSLQQERH